MNLAISFVVRMLLKMWVITSQLPLQGVLGTIPLCLYPPIPCGAPKQLDSFFIQVLGIV